MQTREHLDDVLAELDRRRRELTDLRLQMSRHPVSFAAAALTLAALVGGAIAWAAWRRRRARSRRVRLRRLAAAARQIWEHPEVLVRRGAPPVRKVVLAAATSVAAVAAKRATERVLRER